MPIKVEKVPEEAIILCVFEGKVTTEDLRLIEQRSVALAEDLPKPVARIIDTREMAVSFGDLVVLLFDAARARGNPGAVTDPDFNDVAVVKSGSLAAFGARSMGQDQYGKLNIPVYESMEKALEHARTGKA